MGVTREAIYRRSDRSGIAAPGDATGVVNK